MKKKYKINLHILEACNFKCRQCFSKFGTKKLLSVKDWEKIVDNCIAGADVAEFNIAGGRARCCIRGWWSWCNTYETKE